ncbi:MAG TPA: CDP-diacylglycerol--glycerol-3-phosphate 3-phosphatidyltransferase, partial [Actinomycetota bacterium]|nr:CDP-diacylglycerol--glycerol-3-phosphate 3-phosphatidyltransferase [Actinomycetota bacterium]
LGLGWPNVLSLGRIVLIPAVVLLIAVDRPEARWLALVVFVVGALSDLVDGYLARRHAMTTSVGAWLDPLSDKLFVIVPAIALSLLEEFPWWAAAAIVLREVAVSFLRWRLDRRGVSMPASRAGKAKTLSQVAAVGLSIAPLPSGSDGVVLAVVVVAVALTILSGLEYLLTERHRVETG